MGYSVIQRLPNGGINVVAKHSDLAEAKQYAADLNLRAQANHEVVDNEQLFNIQANVRTARQGLKDATQGT